MLKLLKWFVYLLLTLVVIGGVAIAALLVTFDPNDYKAELAGWLEERTGRPIRFAGPIDLQLFPQLGLGLQAVEIANPTLADARFESPYLARLRQANVGLELLPLLRGTLNISTVRIAGIEVELETLPSGHSNYADLIVEAETPPEASESPSGAEQPEVPVLPELRLGGIQAQDITITQRDPGQAPRQIRIERLDTGRIVAEQPFDLSARVQVQTLGTGERLGAELSSRARLALDAGELRLSTLSLTMKGTLPRGFAASGTLSVPELILAYSRGLIRMPEARFEGEADIAELARTIPLEADLNLLLDPINDMLEIRNARLRSQGVELASTFRLERLSAPEPAVTLSFSVLPFEPREVLPRFGLEVPPSVKPNGLQAVKFVSLTTGTPNALDVRRFEVYVDETKLTGGGRIEGLTEANTLPRVQFEFGVNTLDIDRYADPNYVGNTGTNPNEDLPQGGAVTIELPEALLRALDINGTISMSRLEARGMEMRNVTATIDARDGVIRVRPASARVQGSDLRASAELDVRGEQPRYALSANMGALPIGDLLAALGVSDRVSGTAQVLSIDLAGGGRSLAELRTSLRGELSAQLSDGAIRGVDLRAFGEQLRALYQERDRVIGALSELNLSQDTLRALAPILPELGAGDRAALEQLANSDNPSLASLGQLIRDIQGLLERGPLQLRPQQQTAFSEFVADFSLDRQRLTTRQLRLVAPNLRVEGSGLIDLGLSNLDYNLRASVLDEGSFTLPLRVWGAFDEIRVWPAASERSDLEQIPNRLVARLEQRLVEQAKQRGREEIEDVLRDRVGDELRNLLRDRPEGNPNDRP